MLWEKLVSMLFLPVGLRTQGPSKANHDCWFSALWLASDILLPLHGRCRYVTQRSPGTLVDGSRFDDLMLFDSCVYLPSRLREDPHGPLFAKVIEFPEGELIAVASAWVAGLHPQRPESRC